jgi:hypothetical protein
MRNRYLISYLFVAGNKEGETEEKETGDKDNTAEQGDPS